MKVDTSSHALDVNTLERQVQVLQPKVLTAAEGGAVTRPCSAASLMVSMLCSL